MEMVPPKPVVTMVVVDHAVLVPSAKNVAKVPVSAHPIALVETVEMMDAGATHVVSALQHRPALMEFVLELPPLIVLEDLVDPIVPVEAVEPVLLVKDAVPDNANVTMIVTKKIVVTQSNLKEPTLVYVLKDLVEHAPPVSLVDPMADVQPKLHVL